LKQGGQRGAKILVPARIEEIVFGEEHLCDAEAQLIEGIVVHAHEAALADGGAGLHERELGRTRGEFEALHAQTDRAGGDEQDFAPGAADIGEGLGNTVEGADGHAAIVAHEHVGADLHDHAGGSGNLFSRREFGPLGFAGIDGFSPHAFALSRFLRGVLTHSASRVADSPLRADAIYRNQNRRLGILPARGRGRKVGTITVCEPL